MLSDPGQSDAFRRSPHWNSPLLDFQLRVRQEGSGNSPPGVNGPAYRSNSFSGNERNRLLLAGESGFVDRSLVSGVDCREDARCFAVLDYDGDGWLDMALASVNAPRLRLFRNRMGESGRSGRAVRIRLTGGKESNRDAVGALVTVTTSRGSRVYRRSLGEGLSAQNAGAIRVPLAEGESLEQLRVRWPSGAESTLKPVPDGPLLKISE